MKNKSTPKKVTIKNSESKPSEKLRSKPTLTSIVGIGASAGGLDALEQFFGNMPKDTGLAFVVIQHLDPTHVGIMPELLQRSTEMKVLSVSDHMKVEPNHVYVIPSNKSMSVLNGYLHLFEPIETRGLRLPVDYFFRSLAEDQQEKSIGIILSGMGSDGCLGMKAIKEKHGIVIVQDPVTSKYDGMPRSTMNSVIVDIVGPPNELPSKLISFLKFNISPDVKTNLVDKFQSNLEKVIILLRSQTGHDFSLYKKNTLLRRIERRMGVHQIDQIANYVRFLQENRSEIDILFKELLIGVTNFFRDTAVWEKLNEEIIPKMLAEFPDGYVFRAWVTGCSTGEEAYSLAIVFSEAFEKVKQEKNIRIQIFATDIDSDAIESARKGFFGQNIVSDVSAERLKKFFITEGNGFRVNSHTREMIVFAPHNVIKEPPFTKLDFISCRNLLIYMEPELQQKLMYLFHYSLNQNGIMLLGSAENENSQNLLFTSLDSKLKFYKHCGTSTGNNLTDFPSSFSGKRTRHTESKKNINIPENIWNLADQIILQRFAPASLLINSSGDILYITGRTGKYLELAAGKANMNIFAMALEGLSHELTGAIRKAKQTYDPVKLTNIKIGSNGGTQIVDIVLQQIDNPEAIRGTIMIVFTDVNDIPKLKKRKRKIEESDQTSRERDLEIDLQHSIAELQSTREEMRTTQEGLKSTNEEIQSTNEELQSTNEELTTSKEEMQSLNEELQTVNAELQSKINDFIVANNDMKNLLNSTDIATLFLDKGFNVRRFTNQLTTLFKLRPTDIGRPFTDIVSQLDYPDIEAHVKGVLRTLIPIETPISTVDERWFMVRMMPYRTFDDRIDGVVITFIDISQSKKMESELKKAIAKLRENNL